jgi:hypothetical protein
MIKQIVASVVAVFLVMISFSAFSKIIITGKPVVLELHPGYFTFPKMYTDSNSGYYYVTISGTNRVCYLRKQPELAKLDTIQIVIEKKGLRLPWNCYQFDPRYFEIDF